MTIRDLTEFAKEHLPLIISFATVFAYWLLDLIYKRIIRKSNSAMRNFVIARNADTDANVEETKKYLKELSDEKGAAMEKAREDLVAEKERLIKENKEMRVEIENLKTVCKIGFSNTNELVKTGLARNINRIIDKVEISESEVCLLDNIPTEVGNKEDEV